MYIGPWQEYRLAKIQDDAIQRIRQEWEDNIRAQLPNGDDSRIRELMQPLMAKLPALLMAKKSTGLRDSATPPGTRKPRRPIATTQGSTSTRPPTAASTASSMQTRTESAKSRQGPSNQETHEDETVATKPRRVITRQASTKSTKKKRSGGSATAVEEVERRRKLFAKWMKSQQDHPSPPAGSSDVPQAQLPATETTARLPPIHTSTSRHITSESEQTTAMADATRLPPLTPNVLVSSVDHTVPPASSLPDEEPNLDDSLDEDEVNQLLNWTDNLLSPNALEATLAGLDDDLDDMG